MKTRLLFWALVVIAPLLLCAATIIGYQDWQLRGSAPGNPASGYLRIWADNAAGKLKCLTSGGAACYFDSTITSTTCTAPAVVTAIASTGTATCTTTAITQNSQSSAYTTVLGDAGKHIYHPSADTTARTWTIDSNANVAYPIGTAITFVNDTSAGVLTIAITSDTLVLAGTGATGSRTLAAGGVATALKVTSTRWIINGSSGLT